MSFPSIVWFRQDLRLEDNPAFNAAIQKNSPIIPLYIDSSQEEGNWPLGGASKWWLHHSLKSLSDDLNELGLHLMIRRGSSQKILEEIIKSTKTVAVYWNRRYEPAAIKRDEKVKTHLNKLGIEIESFNANLLFDPEMISNRQNKPFQVFTPFWKACLAMPEPTPPLSHPKRKLKTISIESLSIDELELLPKIHWDKGIEATWNPGSKSAQKILLDFIKEGIYHYPNLRDRPDKPGTSTLSPYLHFGEISPKIIWHRIKQSCDLKQEGVDCYLRQLGWREFAYHLLYHFPETPNTPLRKEFLKFPWDENVENLKAWQKGLTGYPIVDAGMRQLWTTGWMHNRLRMIVGSFLVKDLMIPWQKGAEWFWDTLVDADLANNTLGWQWVAGSGADAAPYFRIFNPITQGQKFDPEGSFVREWIPEIADLPNEWIHCPWEAPIPVLKTANIDLGKTYPYPMVDHGQARIKALEAFKKIKY